MMRNKTIDQKPKRVIWFKVKAQGNRNETSKSNIMNKIETK
jgi:hypothetical protein